MYNEYGKAKKQHGVQTALENSGLVMLGNHDSPEMLQTG